MDGKRKHPSSDDRAGKKSKSSSNGSSQTNNPIKMNKESFLRSLKNLKLYVEGDRYYEQIHSDMAASLNNLDWQAEAKALIDDMSKYVHSIKLSTEHKSSEMQIHFDIETLEKIKLVISMDSCGFRICDIKYPATQPQPTVGDIPQARVYETINSLLDHNSPKYRSAFAEDLASKMKFIE